MHVVQRDRSAISPGLPVEGLVFSPFARSRCRRETRRARCRRSASRRRTSRRARDRTGSRRSARSSASACSTESAARYGRFGRHRVERVGDTEQAGFDRDLLAGELVRVAAAVPALVVVAHVRQCGPEVLDALDQAGAGDRMRPDLPPARLPSARRACGARSRRRRSCRRRGATRRAGARRAARPRHPSLRARLSAIAVTRAEWPRRYGSLASSAAEKVASSDPTVPDFPERAPVPFLAVAQAP